MRSLTIKQFQQLPEAQFTFDPAQYDGKVIRINTDTRTLQGGEVYWALKGLRWDGHQFVPQAVKAGAIFCVVDHVEAHWPRNLPLLQVKDTLRALQKLAALHRSRFSLPLLALTGSNGKTTTKEMLAHLLSDSFKVLKTRGNLNNHIGCPLTLLQLNEEHQVAVLELGTNHPGEIKLLAELVKPTMALITNIGAAHLEYFHTLEGVAREKLSLANALDQQGVFFKNLDDPFLRAWRKNGVKTVTFSQFNKADVYADQVAISANGCATFKLNGRQRVELSVPGAHQVSNALAAAAVALHLGLDLSVIAQRLSTFSPTEGRMQSFHWQGIQIINDAYNANPVSMQAALETLARMECAGNRYVVLGDMLELGENSRQWHRQIIEQALSLPRCRVLTLGTEMALAAQGSKAIAFSDHERLAEFLRQNAQTGDIILFKGSRGMALEKIISLLTKQEHAG